MSLQDEVERIESALHPNGRCAECGGGESYWKHLGSETGDPLIHHPFQSPHSALETVLAAQDDDAVALQRMIDAGMWSLEGSMGRAMMAAIEDGRCVLGPEPAWDYWGNRIPSRDEVKPGSLGSIEYAAKMKETD